MIKLLSTVKTPPVVVILAAARNAAEILNIGVEIVVTSANDSKHMTGSRHYEDKALDFRTKTMTRTQKRSWRDEINRRLGYKYVAILESEGKDNEHLHVEVN